MANPILRSVAAAGIALAVAFAFPASAQDGPPLLDVNIEDAVRSRLERDPGDFFQNGTGFFIADGELVVTSAHVIAGCRDIKVLDARGSELDATLLIWDGRRDVAVLRMRQRYFGGLALQEIELDRRGQERPAPAITRPVGFIMTFGQGSQPRARMQALGPEPARVRVRAYPIELDPQTGQRREQSYEMLRFGIALEPGTSGSPVLNDDGEVAALVTALTGGMTLGTPLRDIARSVQAAGYDPFRRPATSVRDPTDYVVRLRCR